MDFTVSSISDAGIDSFRWAINQSNQHKGVDTINFVGSLNGSTIQLQSSLPVITDKVRIKGSNETGRAPLIEIDFNDNTGLLFSRKDASGSKIIGLRFSNSEGDPLLLEATGVKVMNESLGTKTDSIIGGSETDNSTLASFDGDNRQSMALDSLTGQAAIDQELSPIGCTRVFWNDNAQAKLVGRNADWFAAVDPKGASRPRLLVMPKGLRKSGANFGDQVVVSENPAQWRSRYGSLVVSNVDKVVFEGMNEKGLAAHNLSLGISDYGPRDTAKTGLQMGLSVPYILDNASTVDEAVSLIANIQLVQVNVDKYPLRVSLVIEDKSGDSALIEYLEGKPVIHRGSDVTVVTNTMYEEAKASLPPDNFEPVTNTYPLPGNNYTLDRFTRATWYRKILSSFQPRTLGEANAALVSVMRNVSNPFGSPYTTQNSTDETDWRSISDLTHLKHIFDNPINLNVLHTDLSRIDFSRGTGVRTVNPQNERINGNITNRYRPSLVPVPGLAVQRRAQRQV